MTADDPALAETPARQMLQFFVTYAQERAEDFVSLEAAKDGLWAAAEWAWQRQDWQAVHDLWEALDLWLDSTGDWQTELQLNERAVTADRSLSGQTIPLAKALTARSAHYEQVGKLEAALRDADEALSLARASQDPQALVGGLVRLATIHQRRLQRGSDARDLLLQAWAYCDQYPTWPDAAYVAYQLGNNYSYTNEIDQARKWFETCIARAKQCAGTPFKSLLYESYGFTALGNLALQEGEYEQARSYFLQSLQLKESLGDQYSISVTLNSMAQLEQQAGHLDAAVELHLRALRIYRTIGANTAVLNTLDLLYSIYLQQDKFREALEVVQEALAILRSLPEPNNLRTGLALDQLGRLHERLQQQDEALSAYLEAAQLLEPLDQPQIFGVILHDIADIYRDREEWEQALAYYQRSSEQKARGDNPSDRATTLLSLGSVAAQLGRHDEAIKAFEEALAILLSLPEPDNHRISLALNHLDQALRRSPQCKRVKATKASLNLSFPYWHGSIEEVAYSLIGPVVQILITPGSKGLRFYDDDVIFSRGPDLPGDNNRRIGQLKRTRGQKVSRLVLSFLCDESGIDQASYKMSDCYLHITFEAGPAGLAFDPSSVVFTRIREGAESQAPSLVESDTGSQPA